MNPFQMSVTCDVCGESGMARYGDGNEWLGDKFAHADLRICRDNLRIQRRSLDKTNATNVGPKSE